MGWPINPRPAASLVTLRNQLNVAYPNRDKTSDGMIGDASHRSRTSDHNPWVEDGSVRVVTAFDIDEDLSSSIHSLKHTIDSICASRDPRVKYVIYENKITVKGSDLQQWKAYHGPSPHDHHAHISVFSDKELYDDTSPWVISGVPVADVSPFFEDRNYVVRRGDTLWGIARSFGTSVEAIKKLNGLTVDVIQIEQKLRVR